jgi:nitrogen fixation-related uncharacterized protein
MPRPSARLLSVRVLTVAVGCWGLLWGVANIARGQASDDFRDAEASLLRFETFSPASSIAMLESAASGESDFCDNRAQRALMLVEIPLADAALRSGAVQEFDQRSRSLEDRARQTLGCTPRDSFVWLLLFGVETEHGVLDKHSFDLLAMSYETSPNEAWVAIRRIVLAIPVMRVAPEPIQQKILDEFQNLVAHGLVDSPARSYFRASASIRSLLQSRVDQLDPRSQRNFSEALQKLGS